MFHFQKPGFEYLYQANGMSIKFASYNIRHHVHRFLFNKNCVVLIGSLEYNQNRMLKDLFSSD